jgi:hypothetical protein
MFIGCQNKIKPRRRKDRSKSLLINTCCRKFDSNEDHTRRTLAYCQSQNKHCRKLYKFISAKGLNFIQLD